jgi:hypothetical protein
MRGGEPVEHAPRERERLDDREPPRAQALLERLPLEPLHDQVAFALRRDPLRHVAHDRGVIELRQDGAFAQEALGSARVAEAHDFHGDALLRFAIPPFVDDAHRPRSDLSLQVESPVEHGSETEGHAAL